MRLTVRWYFSCEQGITGAESAVVVSEDSKATETYYRSGVCSEANVQGVTFSMKRLARLLQTFDSFPRVADAEKGLILESGNQALRARLLGAAGLSA